MRRDVRNYLKDLYDACTRIQRLTNGMTAGQYQEDETLRWAVERQLSILGEAMYQMQAFFPQVVARIPESRGIIRFRHVLIHGYSLVDNEVVWGIVQNEIVPLKTQVEELLDAQREG